MFKNQKGFAVQGIVALVGLLLLTGGAYVISQKQKSDQVSQNIITESASEGAPPETKCANGATNYPRCNADLPLNWKTYSWGDYQFSYPAEWKPVASQRGVSFVSNDNNVAVLNCPIREIGYEAWDTEIQSRKVKVGGKDYEIELWSLKDKDRVAASDFSLILINKNNFQQSCEIGISAGMSHNIQVAQKIYSSISFSDSISSTFNWKAYGNQKYGFEFQYPVSGYALDEIQRESAGFTTIASIYTVPPPIEFGANFSVGVKQLSSIPADFEQHVRNIFGNNFIDSEWVSVQMQDWLKVRTQDPYFEKEASVNYFALKGNKIFRIYYFPIGSSNEKDFEKIFASFKFLGTQDAIIVKPSITVTGVSTPGDKIYSGSKVPFLNFSIKASGKDVTIDSFIFLKKGTLRTNALTKLILIDSNGIELAQGTPFTQYDSSNIIKPITIKAGETKTFWLYAWIASDLSALDKDKYAVLTISAINVSDWQNVNVLGNWAVMSNPMRVDLLEDRTPVPILNNIDPSTGSIGAAFTLKGGNLNGFEGTTYLTLINQNGQKGVIGVNSYLPQGGTTLKFVLPSQICTVSMGESGKPCPSYLTITPGAYKIYAQPWSKPSNQLNLIITASNSQSIAVSAPVTGSVLRVGQPYVITWSGRWERGDEIFSINTFPTNSDVYGTIATVPFAQASCSGNGMGNWSNPVTCSYTWIPTYSTPSLQIGIFNTKNGNDFGYSGTFTIVQ